MEAEDTTVRSHLPDLLHEHFHHQARATPGAVAFHCGNRFATFGELRDRVGSVAAELGARGVGEGALVGLHVERSIDQVAAMLGILQAGAAVVPLPPSDPPGRLREILAFGGLDAVIADPDSSLDPSQAPPVLELDDLTRGTSNADGSGASSAGSPDHPAFVLCSSGSTGRPKMIVRSHGSFFHRLRWTWKQHPFREGDLGCHKAHMTTTHSLYELFEPLLAGAPTLIVQERLARDLEAFWECVRTRGVTRLLLVPSALRATLNAPDFRPPALEVLVLMGEYVHPDLAARAVEAFPARTHIYSIYGSTEASSTLVTNLRASAGPGEELPLGVPISQDVRALVLDDNLEPVPPGEEGRLYVAGPPLFSGYWKDPEQTNAVLVDAPGHDGPLYDTRDRVRRTAEGNLLFQGRVDHVVKVRGFRVDLHEVERVLLSHPDVRQAAVVVEGEGTAEVALIGFYAPIDVERAGIFDILRDRLPHYMVPSALVGLHELPLTASAKIDRVRLREDFAGASNGATGAGEATVSRTPTDSETMRPLTGTERQVAEAWERTLGHRRFDPTSSFFEAGGTSLTAFALLHRLREAFDLDRNELSAEALYRFSTLQDLAVHLDDVREVGAAGAGAGARTAGVPTPLLVTLRGAKGEGADHPPLFVVGSAGGTLGAYEELARALTTNRAVVGVRDPFLWGERDPTEGFSRWVDRYVEAILELQSGGPYHVCAYSSAGAFGYEIARRLRAEGRDVSLLALVDPIGLDRGKPWRFGYWALRSTWMRPPVRWAVDLFGRLRSPVVRLLDTLGPGRPSAGLPLSRKKYERDAREARRNSRHLMNVTALLELNTGLPFSLEESDFEGVSPDAYMDLLRDRVAELAPEVDVETMDRLVVQYGIQVRAQHAYELRPYDGRVLLVEPDTPHAGLLAVQLRPYVRNLRARKVPLGPRTDRERAISARFGSLQGHYRSMRDERFVQGLARELDALL